MVKLVYFAWVRERIGKSDETMTLPDNVVTVSDLIAHLTSIDDGYAAAFQAPKVIRVALDKTHAPHDAQIGDAAEIAFFPPMTGG